MKAIIFFGIAIFVVTILGCQGEDPRIDFSREKEIILVTYHKGIPLPETKVTGSSEKLPPIQEILKSKAGHWKISLISYAPVFLLKGTDFNINFQSDHIILNYAYAKDRLKQLVSSMSPAEYKNVQSIFESCGTNLSNSSDGLKELVWANDGRQSTAASMKPLQNGETKYAHAWD